MDEFIKTTRAKYILGLLEHFPDEFIRGFNEPAANVGDTFDSDVSSPRTQAYDIGRTLAEAEGYA